LYSVFFADSITTTVSSIELEELVALAENTGKTKREKITKLKKRSFLKKLRTKYKILIYFF
jgi:hypothetical protein